MPDSKISALPSATVPLAGTEVLPIVQSSVTDKVTAADLLRQNGQTVTTSNPVLSLAQTWNAGGVTFTGLKFNATDTASAAASLLLDLQTGGTSQFSVSKAGSITAVTGYAAGVKALLDIGQPGLSLSSESVVAWSSTTNYFNTKDTILTRDAANTLAQRNSTTAQTFRVYNTYTDSSNYERGTFAWSGNSLFITSERAGTGTAREMVIRAANGLNLSGDASSNSRWQINTSGHFLASTDNIYDIGASGNFRPRTLYVGTSVVTGSITASSHYNGSGDVRAGGSSAFYWSAGSLITSPSDGVIRLTNNAQTDFTRLQFGGTTSSFPAIKRNAATFDFRLADDSNYCSIAASSLGLSNAMSIYGASAIPAGGSTGAGYRMSSVSNFGVFFGSGAPTLSAAQGSLYLRSDGSSTSNRMYVNTDGSTTWTAVTTAA